MRIGELAAAVGVTTRTVRHYHHQGLLPEPERRPNGYREYTLRHAVVLARIRRLTELGLGLGADIPFFVQGQTAWGEGVGERLTPLDLPSKHYAIVFPGVGISTAEIFQAPELTRKTRETTIRGFLRAGGRNDCEPVVAGRSPEVRRALAWLAERGEARMSGTGSCVFAAFDDRGSAQAALADLPTGWRGYVARGLGRSPLQERLAAERSRVSGKV